MCLLSPKSCIIFDPTDGRTSTTEEMLPTEYPDEDTVSCDEFYDKMEDEDFVNCICQIQEENGLMIQVSLEYSLCARPFNVHSFL